MKLYHGSRNAFVAHVGLCLTDDRGAALEYSRRADGSVGVITEVALNTTGLRVANCPGFGEEGDDAAADSAEELAEFVAEGWDVVTYTDQGYDGEPHQTWRLLTPAAVATLRTH